MKQLTPAEVLRDRAVLLRTLERIKCAVEAINRELNDPHQDGTGRDSRVPDCDAYNDLSATVHQLVTDALRHVNRA